MDTENNKPALNSENLIINQDESTSLQIIYKPFFYWEPVALLLGLIFLAIMFFSTEKVQIKFAPSIVLGIIAWIVVFFITLYKRKITSYFDVKKSNLKVNVSGVYSTNINSSDKSLSLLEIDNVGLRRHIRRYGDDFQVFLLLKSKATIDVTGSDLSFSESQLCAETIREFLGIKTKIVAVD